MAANITLKQSGTSTSTITYKNDSLTNNEVDANFKSLHDEFANKQSLSANLTDIAGLATTNNYFIVGTGTNFALESPSSARTSLGLGTIATQNSNAVAITGGTISGLTSLATGTLSTTGNATIGGNLIVNGTTTTVNSNITTLDDPILTLGGDTAPTSDDNKDRGIEFRYYDTAARLGFMGWDDSTGKFVLLKAATNTAEVFSGTKAELDANVAYSNITGTPTIGDGTFTITTSTGLSGGGQLGTANQTGATSLTLTNTDPGSSQNIFKNFAVSGQSTVVADSNNDTLTLIAGTNVTITTDAVNDSITISANDTSVDWSEITSKPTIPSAIFSTIAVSGQSNVVADSATDTLTLVAGSNITITTNATNDSITISSVADTDTTYDLLAVTTTGGAILRLDPSTGTNDDITFTNGGHITAAYTSNTAITLGSDATSSNTVSTIVARDASGNFTAGVVTATDFNTTSDVALKDNIAVVQNPLDIISAISGYTFNWKSDGKEAVGVLAQEVEKVLPQLVRTNSDGHKAVSYDSLIPILLEAIKELAAKVK